MSTSIYIDCPLKQLEESVFVAGASDGTRFWLPIIDSLKLHLLEHAFGAGLTITDEYYAGVIEEVKVVLSKFAEIPDSTPGIGDVISRCCQLLEILKKYPPGSGCELYLG
jgi:hypothetical protein